MQKPTVFLSHSSLDKAALIELKKLLDARAAGSLEFFLSSDGESIRFGRNWVVRISDALSQAKLMFVFLSPQSVDSRWIHFEAGCAYAKDIQVVPVCLPGIDLNRISPPLSLLQGFNLHTHDAIGNLARICNETFDMKINESFCRADFDNVIANTASHGAEFFAGQSWAIDVVILVSQADLPAGDFNPIPALCAVCDKAGTNYHFTTTGNPLGNHEVDLEQPGCTVKFQKFEIREKVKPPGGVQAAPPTVTVRWAYSVRCTLSPELFHFNAPLLDQWLEQAGFASPFRAYVSFRKEIVCERQRERFTSKLYQSGVKLAKNGEYEFEGLTFGLQQSFAWSLEFQVAGKLTDDRLPRILERLFRSTVLWEPEPDFSEMLQGG